MAMQVAIAALDGVTDSGVAVALDVLRAANALARRAGRAAPFAVRVVAVRGRGVATASGLRLAGTAPLRHLRAADAILVPGCWVESAAQCAALLARPAVVALGDALVRAHARGALIGASCTGAFVLARAGLLDGHRATTTWWLAPALRARFPRVDVDAGRALVTDGRVWTAGAVFAIADLALALVGRVAGPTVARDCARALLLDAHPSQAPYMAIAQLAIDEPAVRAAEAYARRHLARGVTVGQLARAAAMSPRTLARRLAASLDLTPVGFVQQLRVETAAHLLATSRATLDEVAAQVGYRDAGTLRRLVRACLGVSPSALRRPTPARASVRRREPRRATAAITAPARPTPRRSRRTPSSRSAPRASDRR